MPRGVPDSYRRQPAREAAPPPPPPPPSVLEGLGASFRVTYDEVPQTQEMRLWDGYRPVVQALRERNGKGAFAYDNMMRTLNPWYTDKWDHDAIWADVEKERARDPQAFAKLPRTKEEFERGLLTRDGRRGDDLRKLDGAPLWMRMAGGIPASFLDPINLAGGILTGPLSAGKPLLKGMLIQGVSNAGIELIETPALIEGRAKMGEKVTKQDVAINVGAAFAFGGLFEAGTRGIGKGWGAGRGQFEQVIAANWERIPAGLRTRWQNRSTIEPADDLVADMAEAIIGRDRMTRAEQDAADILRREGQMAAASPLRDDGAGTQAHDAMLGSMLDRIARDNPDMPVRPRAPVAAAVEPAPARTPRRPPVPGGSALATGTVPGGAIERFMANTRSAESSGDDAARPRDPKTGRLLSSAVGRYQFIDGTWLRYYKRRFGTGGLTNGQILAKRGDGRIQDILMRDLTEDNAKTLRGAGIPITEGNLYLAHFAGPDRAVRIHAADPDTPLTKLFAPEALAANEWLKGKTAGWIMAWVDRKMGGRGVAARGSGHAVELAGPEIDPRGQLRGELDSLNADIARLEAEADRAAPRFDPAQLDEGLDAVPVRDAIPDMPAVRDGARTGSAEPLADLPNAAPVETLSLAGQLRDVAADPKRDLNDIDGLAAEIGAAPNDVRLALMELVREKGGPIRIRKGGGFVRRQQRKLGVRRGGDGPEDVLEFIARQGGIRDDEGHGLGLRSLSAKQRKEIISSSARRRAEDMRRSGGGSRNWKKMTRYHGPLLRHEGRSIDAIGEILHESGYLNGRDGGRPTTADVLEYLDARIADGQPRYTMSDQTRAQEAAAMTDGDPFAPPSDGLGLNSPDAAVRMAAYDIEEAARARFGIEQQLDDEFLEHAARWHLANPDVMDPGEAFARAVNDYADATRWDGLDESGDVRYEEIDYDWPRDHDPDAFRKDSATADDFAGWEPVSRNEATGEGGAWSAGSHPESADAPRLSDLPPDELARYSDPDGPSAKAQADSLAHDAAAMLDRGAASDPNIAARQSQQAQLGAEAPLRATAEQDGTMGTPLFDAADQPQFRLSEADDAPGQTLRDLMDEFDREAMDIKNARDCL